MSPPPAPEAGYLEALKGADLINQFTSEANAIAHGRAVFDPELQVASLDHAIWFHRTVRMQDWHLYSQDSPNASGARGFTRGGIYTTEGVLVASVAQEGLIRERRKP